MKKSPLIFAAALAAALTLLVWLLGMLTAFKNFEYETLSGRFKLRDRLHPVSEQNADPRLVLVGIDDKSTSRLGAWPFPRKTHAQLLAFLADEKPAVVTWDILFTEPKPDAPENDELLVEAAKLFPHFISCASRGERDDMVPGKIGPTQPLTKVTGDLSKVLQAPKAQLPFNTYRNGEGVETGASLLQNSLFGFADNDADSDGLRRYLPVIVSFQGKAFASLPLQTVMEYYKVKPDDVTIELGKQITIPIAGKNPIVIPINARGEMLINYRRALEQIKNIRYYSLLYLLSGKGNLKEAVAQNPDFENLLKKELPALTDNIVLIGFTGQGFDTGNTPLQQGTPMVTVQANSILNILQQDFLYPVPAAAWLVLVFLILLSLSIRLMRVNLLLIMPVGLVSVLLYAAFSYALFDYGHLWIPTALPMVAILLATLAVTAYLYFGEESQKRQIKTAMAAYLPAKVMDRVLAHPDNLKLGGTKRELTVLFCDIRGFTKYCENKEPEDVVSVLNEYMEVMTDVIFKYEGTIDKYIGDCIMAFWNAPEDQPDHAQRAVCCAMEMRYALANYKTKRAGIDREIFECGIGIHTGPALVGNIGSTKRLSYTAIGATVNMAARLESLTKQFMTRIIVSEATSTQIQGDFTLSDLGEVSIPGFVQRTRLFSVEAQQDISSALLVGRKVAHESNTSVASVQQPLWAPAPLPEDAEVDEHGKG